jgi:uncharacterized membrane protein
MSDAKERDEQREQEKHMEELKRLFSGLETTIKHGISIFLHLIMQSFSYPSPALAFFSGLILKASDVKPYVFF